MLLRLLISLLLIGFATASSWAVADSNKEITLFNKSLQYIKGLEVRRAGGLRLGVFYDSRNPVTKREAEAFIVTLQKNRQSASIVITPLLIDVQNLATVTPVDLAYISGHLTGQYRRIYQYAKEHRIFTFSTSKDCVVNRCCILSFDASTGINIFLNESNLRALGFGIDGAFKFMVTRV